MNPTYSRSVSQIRIPVADEVRREQIVVAEDNLDRTYYRFEVCGPPEQIVETPR